MTGAPSGLTPPGSPCAVSNPEVLGQPEGEAELGTEMLGDLEEEGLGGVHPGEWLQGALLPSPLPAAHPRAAELPGTGHQGPPGAVVFQLFSDGHSFRCPVGVT